MLSSTSKSTTTVLQTTTVTGSTHTYMSVQFILHVGTVDTTSQGNN